MSTVFISYSHTDSSSAEAIVAVLEELDILYFRDVRNITWGDSITSTVREGLEKSGALIVIISPGSLKSDWVHFEVGYAMALQRRVLPFLTHPSLDLPGYSKDLMHVQTPEEIREFFLSNPDWGTPTNRMEIEESREEVFQKVVEMMPDLLDEMKDDLSNLDNKFIRKFIPVDSKAAGEAVGLPKDHFVYYGDVHQRLRNKVDLLEEFGFVRSAHTGQYWKSYRMTDDFVQAIINWEMFPELPQDRGESQPATGWVRVDTVPDVNATALEAVQTGASASLRFFDERSPLELKSHIRNLEELYVRKNTEALIEDAWRIVDAIRTWAKKPVSRGGPRDLNALAKVTFAKIGFGSSSNGIYKSDNGLFDLRTSLSEYCGRCIIPSGSTPIIYIHGTNTETGKHVCVAMAGTTDNDSALCQ